MLQNQNFQQFCLGVLGAKDRSIMRQGVKGALWFWAGQKRGALI